MTAVDVAPEARTYPPAAIDAPPPESERFRLARIAREAALQIPGVAGADAGPHDLFITVGGGRRLDGVVCSANRSGGYDVSLRLVCNMVPLLALSERVQAGVQAAAGRARVPLERVSVHVSDIAEAP